MGWDAAMHARRIGVAALFVALGAAACGGGSTQVAARGDAGNGTPAGTLGSTANTATTLAPAPTTAAATPPAPDAGAPAAQPVTTEASAPEPASIEVDYQPAAGSSASATISGPNGTHSKSLDSGAAIFGGLPDGAYTITVIIDTPSGDPTVGDARQILNGGSITVGPGDRGVVSCDDSGCTGVLNQ
jgi:hypothetical protein